MLKIEIIQDFIYNTELNYMIILAIETSCDDTGIAILEAPDKKGGDFSVLSNIVSSQIEVHKKYGGVFPAMAKREHQKNIIPTLKSALTEAKMLKNHNSPLPISNKLSTLKNILEREPELLKKITPFLKKCEKPAIDLITVTEGPGLEPCLWVGVNFAKALSFFWDIPIVPVNHIESHILVNYLNQKEIALPAIALVVSGGHTQLILMNKIPTSRQAGANYKILGETRDDAAGECFDKAAKILGLEYPGGPIISKLAEKAEPGRINLPRPMIDTKNYDFSFSGLKTAILYYHQKQPKKIQKNKQYIAEMSAEIQQAIVDVLIKKTIKATKDFNAKTIILGGGVSANHELKTQFVIKIHENLPGVKFLFPEIDHSTDNGLMTAITGYFHKTRTKNWKELEAKANLRIA